MNLKNYLDGRTKIKYVAKYSCKTNENKFALLWGEAQLCLPYVCL